MARSSWKGGLLGRFAKGHQMFLGVLDGDNVTPSDAERMMDFARGEARFLKKKFKLADLRVLAPVDSPGKIVAIGLNYRSHIDEMDWETPKKPIIFSKPSSSIIGPGEDIVMPRASRRVDYEGESAVVIGKRAKNATDGGAHIFGWTCLNDVTARDLQRTDVDWTRAKGFDTFCPIGPYISKRPPTRVKTVLNGRIVQDASTSDRVFGDAALVEYISTIMTLEPGDIIATGTPSGIGPMSAGDVVEVQLDGIGSLRNQVIRAD
jgi:2-keto-4-pentenoate hydratase/2-oxohepta-3-ene-1,7-dioic acid hydratase in catechol pathway